MSYFKRVLLIGALAGMLAGCGEGRPHSAGYAPVATPAAVPDVVGEQKKLAEVEFQKLATEAGEPISEVYRLATEAKHGPSSLADAAEALTKHRSQVERADGRLRSRIEELIGIAAFEQVTAPRAKGQPVSPAAARVLETVHLQDQDIENLAKTAVAIGGDPQDKRPLKEAMQASTEVLKKKAENLPAYIPQAPAHLQKYVTRAQELEVQIQAGIKHGKDVSKLVREFAENNEQASPAFAKALQDGTAKADEVMGVAVQLAGSVAGVVAMVENWDSMDDVQRVSAAAATLAGVLQAVQPFLTASPAAPYKAAAVVALTILSKILPALNLGGDSDSPGGSDKWDKSDKPKPGQTGGAGEPTESPAPETERTANGQPGQESPAEFKPTSEERNAIRENAKTAENQSREKLGQPGNATPDPKKVPKEKTADIVAESVSGGDPQLKESVLLALQLSGRNPGDNLAKYCELAAWKAAELKALAARPSGGQGPGNE